MLHTKIWDIGSAAQEASRQNSMVLFVIVREASSRLWLLQIWEWVKAFCAKTGVSGQLCFDFMRDSSDGRMYAFECNPRTSTILLNFYDHDHVAQAFFNAKVLTCRATGACQGVQRCALCTR